MIHHVRTESASSRKVAADEHAATLKRTRRKHLPVTKNGLHGTAYQKESASSRKVAADEHAATLKRTRRKHLPVTKMVYMGLPTRRRKTMMQQWAVAFPAPAEGPLYS